MEFLLKPVHVFDQHIIDGLRSSGVTRRKAEDQLFERYSYLIRAGEERYALREDDLFDGYSDTVLAVIHSISNGSFKGRSSLKTFVCEIFHNKCVDLIRKKTARKNIIYKTEPIGEMQAFLSDNSMSIIEKLTKNSDLDSIKQRINGLSGKNKQVLLLSADGYTDKEIAVLTEFKTADVVKTCRLRCLKKLRREVSQDNSQQSAFSFRKFRARDIFNGAQNR